MLSPCYKGLKIVVSNSAMLELFKLGKDMHNVLAVLELGYDAPRKRKKGTIERWLDKGNKTYNAVLVKDYNEIIKEECWVLIHFGRFTKRK